MLAEKAWIILLNVEDLRSLIPRWLEQEFPALETEESRRERIYQLHVSSQEKIVAEIELRPFGGETEITGSVLDVTAADPVGESVFSFLWTKLRAKRVLCEQGEELRFHPGAGATGLRLEIEHVKRILERVEETEARTWWQKRLRQLEEQATKGLLPLTVGKQAEEPLEPTRAEEKYEQILNIIRNMVAVIERSPHAFAEMGEEDLRQHFLVQLNGQYEGGATGETFNFGGKTDILIREDGRNIFIAECKFWRGAKAFLETIGQLLGYTSWRDTKTAILLFNRNRNLSAVLEQIPELVESHANYKRSRGVQDETIFRYVFHQPNDPNRELLVTVMVFDVPQQTT